MTHPKAISSFIRRHKLHQTIPVDLRVIQDLYDVSYLPLSNVTLGFAFATKSVNYIGVNRQLHPFGQRMVISHEFAHHVLMHVNSFVLCQMGSWWYDHIELEAQRAASAILVPEKPLLAMARQGYSLREMQDLFEVPAELVQLRLRMAGVTT